MTKILEKLSKSQIALIEQVRQEWLDRLFSCQNRTNREEARKSINWLYKLCGLPEPLVICLDSPLGIQYGANMLKGAGGDQVRDQVWAQVRDQVWAQVWDQVGAQVWAQVWAQVRDQVRDQVRAQVRDQVWDQVRDQVWAEKLEYFYWGYRGDIYDYDWVSFYDYFTRIKVINHQAFNEFLFLLKTNIFGTIQFRNVCLVSDMPISIKRDEQNRLHSTSSPAIEWADGFRLYFLHGVAFDEILWKKIITKSLGFKQILALKNMEQRMAVLKVYGPEFVLQSANAKLIDKSDKGNELYKITGLFSVDAYYLKYKDPSTDRVYVSGIDPEVGKQGSADLGMCWKFQLSLKEYLGIKGEA